MTSGRGWARKIRVATPAATSRRRRSSPRRGKVAREDARQDRALHSPEEAVAGAQAVYTDVWASMGQEEEAAARAKIFAPYQVNAIAGAAPRRTPFFCIACPPIAARSHRRGDGFAALDVFDQAENRLHVQKAILLMLLS